MVRFSFCFQGSLETDFTARGRTAITLVESRDHNVSCNSGESQEVPPPNTGSFDVGVFTMSKTSLQWGERGGSSASAPPIKSILKLE